MKRTFLPFVFKINNTYVFRRTKKIKEEIKTDIKIFYKIDFLEYKVIKLNLDNEEYTVKQINEVCKDIVNKMDKKFLD